MYADDLIARITTGYLNTVDDPLIGDLVSSGTGQSQYGGQLGKIISFTHARVPWSTNTLYGGRYQYVKTKAGSTDAPARGLVAFWDDEDAYQVTPDAPTGTSKVAGVYLNAPTKGNYCWVQVGGLATVKFAASITKATPAIGDLVIVKATTNTGDVLADATGLSSVEARSILGVASEAPAGGGLKLVELWGRFLNI